MICKDYYFSGEDGFHARPVSEFVDISKRFQSQINIVFEGETYDGKSPLSMMCSCIEDKSRFELIISGEDEIQAYHAIQEKMILGDGQYFVEAVEEQKLCEETNLYVCVNDTITGVSLSGGIAIGKTIVYQKSHPEMEKLAENPDVETEKLFGGINALLDKLHHMEQQTADQNAAGILKAHKEIISDQSFIDSIQEKIAAEGFSSIYSIYLVAEEVRKRFEDLKNERMRERAADIKDVSQQLINQIRGDAAILEIKEPGSIIVAEELLPSDTINLDTSKVVGFITEKGGRNCHSAIIARSLGIPAISNVEDAVARISDGIPVILDGDEGCCYLQPDDIQKAVYEKRLTQMKKEKDEDCSYISLATHTIDGREIELAANIFQMSEVKHAISMGAEGIGLFRTEFLYMDRDIPPSCEEQFHCYRDILEEAGDLPVTIRTLDAGGDKPAPCLPMPKEENPFLGLRAIRYCLKHEDVFRAQIRALLMASAYGNLRIMFPMITMVEELLRTLDILRQEKEKLETEGIKIGKYQVGIMIETPSAAVMSGELAGFVDFFSIGSNDLNQYVMAADRGLGDLSEFHSNYHPAVLRLIRHVVLCAEQNGIWVGVCGESGGDPLLIPFYLGMGIRELSMSPHQIASARRIANHFSFEKKSNQVEPVLESSTTQELLDKLKAFGNN